MENGLRLMSQELLKDDLNLPIVYDRVFFQSVIQDIFQKYLASAELLENEQVLTQQEVETVKTVCKLIQKSVDEYFNGFPACAYNQLEKGINLIEQYFPIVSNLSDQRDEFYRVRYDHDRCLIAKEDLFHIPFESRGKVKTQRYSISGLPCLYFGSSVYSCWEELRRPDLDKLYVSSFTNAGPLRMIDFGYPPRVAVTRARKIQDIIIRYNTIKAYYLCWPLFAACSIRVREDSDPFKPEYVVPQLLLQWVRRSTDFDGVKYFTGRSFSFVRSVHLYQNYVFPVKTNRESGYCRELAKNFLMTDPVGWNEFKDEYDIQRSSSKLFFAVGRKGAINSDENNEQDQQDYRTTYYAFLEEQLKMRSYSAI
jgi:hypothetical protein